LSMIKNHDRKVTTTYNELASGALLDKDRHRLSVRITLKKEIA